MNNSSDATAPFAAATGSAIDVQRISKFLRIVSDASKPNERGVMSNDNKLIAIIGYYKPWREWVLYPQPNTVWSTGCLTAINDHLDALRRDYVSRCVKHWPNEKLTHG